MLNKSGERKPIEIIAVEVAIKEPQGGDPFTLISEKWFVNMLACHGHSFVNHLLHFKM